jgi:hypothetical protein
VSKWWEYHFEDRSGRVDSQQSYAGVSTAHHDLLWCSNPVNVSDRAGWVTPPNSETPVMGWER